MPTTVTNESLVLQRSPICTCGGNCPRCAPLQTKLKIGKPNDKYEREADRIADRVMRMPASDVRSGQKGRDSIQTKRAEGISNSGVASHLHLHTARCTGGKLPQSTRDFFEPRFGQDFSDVRVHASDRAVQMAGSLNAQAFTHGNHIYFNREEYQPGTARGDRLLAHELTHVIQQGAGAGSQLQRQPIPGSGDVEELPLPDFGDSGAESTQSEGGCGGPDLGPSSDRLDLEFAADRFTLTTAQREQVGQFVEDWEARGANEAIEVDGYASTDGPEDYNMRLSRKRAQSVRVELIDRGVPVDMVDTAAHGETTAFCSPEANRRAVIRSLPSGPQPVIVPNLRDVPKGLTDAFCRGIFGGVNISVDDVRVNGVSPGAKLDLVLYRADPYPDLVLYPNLIPSPYMHLHAMDSVTYEPRVTLHVSAFATLYSGMQASDFEAGLIQNVMQTDREFTYENGVVVRTETYPPPPINDTDEIGGFPFLSLLPPSVMRFKESGDSVRPSLDDVPQDSARLVLSDEPACLPGGGVIEQSPLVHMKVNDLFRTWVAVHHRPTGCLLAVHHIDWQPDWSVSVAVGQTSVFECNVTRVLEADGDGSPKFVTGRPRANDSDYKSCSSGSGVVAVDDDMERFRRNRRRR